MLVFLWSRGSQGKQRSLHMIGYMEFFSFLFNCGGWPNGSHSCIMATIVMCHVCKLACTARVPLGRDSI